MAVEPPAVGYMEYEAEVEVATVVEDATVELAEVRTVVEDAVVELAGVSTAVEDAVVVPAGVSTAVDDTVVELVVITALIQLLGVKASTPCANAASNGAAKEAARA